MGSPPDETGRYDDEGPQRRVQIKSFAAGKHEVTWAEYDVCVSAGACSPPRDDGFGKGGRPVTHVSWDDVQVYARWLSASTGMPYRLLSEADCKYAPLPENQTEAWLAAIPMCSSVALDGDELSEKLDTRVVQMVYDSDTDVRVARIWDQGVCVEYLALESTEFDEFRDPDEPNHLGKKPKSNHSVVTKDEDSKVRITFQSTLVKLPENALQVGPKLLDQRFRELAIPFFPALFQD